MKELADLHDGTWLLPTFLRQADVVESEQAGAALIRVEAVKFNGKVFANPEKDVDIMVGDVIQVMHKVIIMTNRIFKGTDSPASGCIMFEETQPKQRID